MLLNKVVRNNRGKLLGIFVFIIMPVFVVLSSLSTPACALYRNNFAEFRTSGDRFQIQRDGVWQDFLIKGINMGMAKPGAFPGDAAITKEEYLRWFRLIADMNANSIRVFTLHPPAFYEALYIHNTTSDRPLYLFQGVWINENAVNRYLNAFAPAIMDEFIGEIKRVIDALHGNLTLSPRPGHAHGVFNRDVSPFVAGYILGIELHIGFVFETNRRNPGSRYFEGEFIYTKGASPMEAWLARMANIAISHKQSRYNTQRPVSWINWVTTDPLTHTNEPFRFNARQWRHTRLSNFEDGVSINTENIRATENFWAGLFASYHVYPYYPKFMSFQPEYISFVDHRGEINPFKAYLLALKAHHSVPLVIAEFGLPSSRGMSQENKVTGLNQGFLTEEQQGKYVSRMFEDIVSAGGAGGIIFVWQDEWFKTVWNTRAYDLPHRRPLWPNFQASEQSFGLLTFDPGADGPAAQVDGDISEWSEDRLLSDTGETRLYAASDEKFFYLMIQDRRGIEGRKYVIGIDSVEGHGNLSFRDLGVEFERAMNFAIVIDGRYNSAVLVDPYYDVFYRQYSLLGMIPRDGDDGVKNTGRFNPIRLLLHGGFTLPLTREVIPLKYYETGRLRHGNSNPASDDFDSLADFFMNTGNNSIEIRIPWQLLNVADPSSLTVIGDLFARNYFYINPTRTAGFSLELHSIDYENPGWRGCWWGRRLRVVRKLGAGKYVWERWENPGYRERLKRSYYIIKETFGRF